MRSLGIAVTAVGALLLACHAEAQIIGSGHVIGNGTSSSAAPTDTSLLSIFNQAGSGLSRSGTTNVLGTVFGDLTNGDCVSINNGNLIDAGGACTVGGGGGTVSSGVTNQLAYYAADGTTVTGTKSPSFAATGSWYAPTANIQRWNDHMFVGGATVNDGLSPNGNQDWLSGFEQSIGLSQGATQFYEISALTEPGSASAAGASGILAGTQSLYNASAGTTPIGMASFAVNNNATLAISAYGFYGECHRETSAVGQCIGIEVDPRAAVAEPNDPRPGQQGLTVGYQVGCGAGVASTGFPCGAAMQIEPNPESFLAGIVFGSGSITTGAGGGINAISLPVNYQINWFSGTTIAGTIAVDGNNNLQLNSLNNILVDGTSSVNCSGSPSPSFQAVHGIVTHC